nr:MAG: hypothetical protein DIU68_14250 [Chloroflexota bacterium]
MRLVRLAPPGFSVDIMPVNAKPALAIRDANGRIVTVINVDIRDGRIAGLQFVLNPDKLAHLNR